MDGMHGLVLSAACNCQHGPSPLHAALSCISCPAVLLSSRSKACHLLLRPLAEHEFPLHTHPPTCSGPAASSPYRHPLHVHVCMYKRLRHRFGSNPTPLAPVRVCTSSSRPWEAHRQILIVLSLEQDANTSPRGHQRMELISSSWAWGCVGKAKARQSWWV